MASRLGDQTARLQGRITLNPMYHIDPIGTLLFPALVIFGPFFGFSFFSGFLIGWAKPTPVITRNFKKIVRDDNLVTLAGPLLESILLVALAFAILAVVCMPYPAGERWCMRICTARWPSRGGLQPVVLLALLAIDQSFALLLQPAAHSAARWQPRGAQHAALQRRQFYDRIGGWMSYLLMIFVGGFILRLLLWPALGWSFRRSREHLSRAFVRPLPLQWNEPFIRFFHCHAGGLFARRQEFESHHA